MNETNEKILKELVITQLTLAKLIRDTFANGYPELANSATNETYSKLFTSMIENTKNEYTEELINQLVQKVKKLYE